MISKLFLTFGLVALLGVFSIKVSQEARIPYCLELTEVIVTITGFLGFIILAFVKIWA